MFPIPSPRYDLPLSKINMVINPPRSTLAGGFRADDTHRVDPANIDPCPLAAHDPRSPRDAPFTHFSSFHDRIRDG